MAMVQPCDCQARTWSQNPGSAGSTVSSGSAFSGCYGHDRPDTPALEQCLQALPAGAMHGLAGIVQP
jgi:hypothetical protein